LDPLRAAWCGPSEKFSALAAVETLAIFLTRATSPLRAALPLTPLDPIPFAPAGEQLRVYARIYCLALLVAGFR
jgi:hypothetical protein